MKYIYSTSQMSKLSLTLRTFSITGSVAGLFLTLGRDKMSWKYLKAIVKDKILLNIPSKLIEKIIRERLQFQAISNNFIHPNQLRELKQ